MKKVREIKRYTFTVAKYMSHREMYSVGNTVWG